MGGDDTVNGVGTLEEYGRAVHLVREMTGMKLLYSAIIKRPSAMVNK